METLFYLGKVPVVFATCLRVKSAKRKEGLHYYDIRHEDECPFTPCTVENFVWVDHFGTIATMEPLNLEDGYIEFNGIEAAQLLQVFYYDIQNIKGRGTTIVI